MAEPRETYLGDGLYLRFDGYHFWLRAPRENGDHVVALEPQVLLEFLRAVTSLLPGGLLKEARRIVGVEAE